MSTDLVKVENNEIANVKTELSSDVIEPIYIEVLRRVVETRQVSISMVQRYFCTGYNKAGEIVEWMEKMGYVSSAENRKSREVFITKEEFESKYGSF